jgi:hypothetical protein
MEAIAALALLGTTLAFSWAEDLSRMRREAEASQREQQRRIRTIITRKQREQREEEERQRELQKVEEECQRELQKIEARHQRQLRNAAKRYLTHLQAERRRISDELDAEMKPRLTAIRQERKRESKRRMEEWKKRWRTEEVTPGYIDPTQDCVCCAVVIATYRAMPCKHGVACGGCVDELDRRGKEECMLCRGPVLKYEALI